MSVFKNKKKISIEVQQPTLSAKDKVHSVKTGTAFMLEKYDEILKEEVAIGTAIRNIQGNFADVISDVDNLSKIISSSKQSLSKTADIASSIDRDR